MLSLVKPGSPGMEDDKRTQQPPSQACPGARVARARPLPRRKTLEGGEGDRKRNWKWLWLHGGQSATWQPLSLHTTWCRWQQVRVVSCQLPKAGRWMPLPSPCRRAPRAHACGSVSSHRGTHPTPCHFHSTVFPERRRFPRQHALPRPKSVTTPPPPRCRRRAHGEAVGVACASAPSQH